MLLALDGDQLALFLFAVGQGIKLLLQTLRHAIEGMCQVTDFIRRIFEGASTQITLGELAGRTGELLQTAADAPAPALEYP
ncbi:MAG: hypothetical protein AB3X44_15930 [Leptothrix sp. (in: b-proteobacteria)]